MQELRVRGQTISLSDYLCSSCQLFFFSSQRVCCWLLDGSSDGSCCVKCQDCRKLPCPLSGLMFIIEHTTNVFPRSFQCSFFVFVARAWPRVAWVGVDGDGKKARIEQTVKAV